jgi:hypothetical protein
MPASSRNKLLHAFATQLNSSERAYLSHLAQNFSVHLPDGRKHQFARTRHSSVRALKTSLGEAFGHYVQIQKLFIAGQEDELRNADPVPAADMFLLLRSEGEDEASVDCWNITHPYPVHAQPSPHH